jgi:uncharacterized membrane protein YbhN (UPF0104 family)
MKRGSVSPTRRLRRGLIWAGLLTLLAACALIAVAGSGPVEDRLATATPWWLVVAALLELLSCLGFVLTFRLVFPLLERSLARRIAWTELAFGAVVPLGGAGGVGIGAWILHAKGVRLGLVARRSGVLFLLTSAINALVLALSGLGLGSGLLDGRHRITLGLLPAVLALVIVAVFVATDVLRSRLTKSGRLGASLRAIADTTRMTRRLLLAGDWRAAFAAGGYLLFDIAVLWACFHAFGYDPPAAAILLGYQIGYLANLVPVPGGIGPLDGGLSGALLLYGTPPGPTLAAVVVYHAIALWLPTLGGTLAFASLRGTLDKPLPAAVRRRIERRARYAVRAS